jgi:hypothetical protein
MKRVAVVAVVAALLYFPSANAGAPVGANTYTGCLDTAGDGKGKISKVALGTTPIGGACKPTGFTQITLSGGDITSVAAGTGLSGGATSGDATVAIDPFYRLPQMCSAGQVPEWNGMGWSCGDIGGIAFRAFAGGVPTPIVNGSTQVAMASETFDIGSAYDTGQSRYFPPRAGIYHLDARVQLSSVDPATSATSISILNNGTAVCDGSTDDTVTRGLVVSCLVSVMAPGIEAFTVRVTLGGTGATIDQGSAITWFSGHIVS